MDNRMVICTGGPRDGWEGTILHGRKISFPIDPKAQYEITEKLDCFGRRIAVPVDSAAG